VVVGTGVRPRRLSRVRATRTLLLAGLTAPACGDRPGASAAPGADRPELYGAGLFSTGEWDFFLAWTPDQRRALFCRASSDFSSYQIYQTTLGDDGRWSPPTLPRFAGEWSNADPHIAPDGTTLYFISNRSVTGAGTPQTTYDIWSATREPGGDWGDPRRLDAPVSLPGVDEWSPSVAAGGSLYFGSERPGGRGGMDLWVVHRQDGGYGAPENLGDSINGAGNEVEPWIAPDESYLIFSGYGPGDRADSAGHYDLYLSRRVRGVWQRVVPLDHGVDTPASEFNQSVSPDGRWLYFSSTRPLTVPLGARFDSPADDAHIDGIGNGRGDIYRIALRVFGLGPDAASAARPAAD
jgi:Tol biopolymer transport system component